MTLMLLSLSPFPPCDSGWPPATCSPAVWNDLSPGWCVAPALWFFPQDAALLLEWENSLISIWMKRAASWATVVPLTCRVTAGSDISTQPLLSRKVSDEISATGHSPCPESSTGASLGRGLEYWSDPGWLYEDLWDCFLSQWAHSFSIYPN